MALFGHPVIADRLTRSACVESGTRDSSILDNNALEMIGGEKPSRRDFYLTDLAEKCFHVLRSLVGIGFDGVHDR